MFALVLNFFLKAKPTFITSAGGSVTAIGYDAEWRKTSETEGYGTADEATTAYTYDAVGNLTQVTDARAKLWKYTYDVRDRVATFKNPLNHLTSWTYDAVSNRLTETQPKGDDGLPG